MYTVDALLKAVTLVPSPSNGICFCKVSSIVFVFVFVGRCLLCSRLSSQGTLAAAKDVDILDAVKRLAPYIKFVHFRNVVGRVPQ